MTRQCDIIVYSFTVHHTWEMEFLATNSFTESGYIIDRKLNVALTRARHHIIMTGDISTLSTNPTFCELLEYIKANGCIHNLQITKT